MFEAIARRSLSDAVFHQLMNRIVSDELPAGSELPSERVLCDMLGVNRGAVREGLKRLQQAGLVTIRQGGPTLVEDYLSGAGLELLPSLLVDTEGHMKVAVARSIIRMRQTLAPDIARQAAQRGGPALASELDKIVERMRDATDLAELQQMAWDYWQALVRGSGNIAYRLAFNSLQKTYRTIWSLLRETLADEFRDVATLARLATAVRQGDAEGAAMCATSHVRKGCAAMNAVLDVYRDAELKLP